MLRIKQFTFNPFGENTYVVYNSANQCYIIDPGMYGSIEENKIMNFIQEAGLKPLKIINTHAHIDHILGVEYFKTTYNIPFGLHKLDIPVLQNAWLSAQMFQLRLPQVPTLDFEIEADTTIYLGDEEIHVLFVPGHSPGSIAFYYPKGKWVISGDALFQRSIGRTDLQGGDFDTLANSIRTQLYSLPADTIVYSGHGDPTTIGEEQKLNPFVRADEQ